MDSHRNTKANTGKQSRQHSRKLYYIRHGIEPFPPLFPKVIRSIPFMHQQEKKK